MTEQEIEKRGRWRSRKTIVNTSYIDNENHPGDFKVASILCGSLGSCSYKYLSEDATDQLVLENVVPFSQQAIRDEAVCVELGKALLWACEEDHSLIPVTLKTLVATRLQKIRRSDSLRLVKKIPVIQDKTVDGRLSVIELNEPQNTSPDDMSELRLQGIKIDAIMSCVKQMQTSFDSLEKNKKTEQKPKQVFHKGNSTHEAIERIKSAVGQNLSVTETIKELRKHKKNGGHPNLR